jgi:putative NADH-flavin reductase
MRIAVAGSTGQVGRGLGELARASGHEVVEIARSKGVDLLTGAGLDLDGVEAVVDVTQGPVLDEQEATAFFETVARTLGGAAHAVGVQRTIVLSIIGVDLASKETDPAGGAVLRAHRAVADLESRR